MRSLISPEPALLGLLLDRPLHGYDLYKRVRERLGLVWRIEISQMYAILSTYTDRGWIASRTQAQAARPARKILEITHAGRSAFEEWLNQPAHGMREFRVDFFLRLYFSRAVGTHAAKRLIALQTASLRRELQVLRSQVVVLERQGGIQQLILDFRIQQSKAILKWLETHEDQLIHSPARKSFETAQIMRKTEHALALDRKSSKALDKEK